jgi:hypothetical protein
LEILSWLPAFSSFPSFSVPLVSKPAPSPFPSPPALSSGIPQASLLTSVPRAGGLQINSPPFSTSPLLNLAGDPLMEKSFTSGQVDVPENSNPHVPDDLPESSLRRDNSGPSQEEGHNVRRRKKRKQLKRRNNKHLSLGIDLDMDEVIPMADRMLVGKVRSRPWGYNALYCWMQENWGGHLQQIPQLSFLA